MPPLIPLTVAWLLGLLVDARQPLPPWVWLAAGLLAATVAWAGRARLAAPAAPAGSGSASPPPPIASRALFACLLLVPLALGGARHAIDRPAAHAASLTTFNDFPTKVTITGRVVAYPEQSGTETELRVAARTLRTPDGRLHVVTGHLLATLPRYQEEWRYGAEVRLRGTLETPPVFDGFSYRDYLARQGIHSLLTRAGGEQLPGGPGAPLLAVLYDLRDRARATIAALLPDPQAALLTGILLGVDDGIPDTLMETFTITGTSHVLVISGFNFAVIAALLSLLTVRIAGRVWGSWLAIAGIAFYALLVGAEPAVQRAAVMGALYVVGRGLGRETLALNSLAAAALLLTALNPQTPWDLGFQLSALATLGMILFVPPLTRRAEQALAPLGSRRKVIMPLLVEGLIVTLAAQLTTTPLIVAAFGRLSPVSLLANLLILPVQSWIMLHGGLATLAGLLWLPLGWLPAQVAWLALSWTVLIVEWAARFPAASAEIPGFRGPWVAGSYALLFGATAWKRGWRPPTGPLRRLWQARPRRAGPYARTMIFGLVTVAVLLPWIAVRLGPDGRLHLYTLDVGQGDALLVVTPAGQQIVIDGGPEPERLLAAVGRRLPPWDRRIELLVLTHPDSDHLGGLPELLARYQVQRVLHPGIETETALFGEWQQRLAAEEAAIVQARRGQIVEVEPGVRLEVLHPDVPSAGDSTNDSAVVLRLRHGATCALLLGDVEMAVEEALVADGLGPCAILKVAHHGSATSSTAPLLSAVRPAVALISVGEENRFGHPAPEVLERLATTGARILRTDQRGTIELVSDGERLWLRTER